MTQPASTCGHCSREGTISLDQRSHEGASGTTNSPNLLAKRMRFHCTCGNEWVTDALEAEQHGRFLDRSGLR